MTFQNGEDDRKSKMTFIQYEANTYKNWICLFVINQTIIHNIDSDIRFGIPGDTFRSILLSSYNIYIIR